MSKPRIKRTWPALAPDVAQGHALGTIEDAAIALRLSVSRVEELRAAGLITPANLGGALRFHLPSVLNQVTARPARA